MLGVRDETWRRRHRSSVKEALENPALDRIMGEAWRQPPPPKVNRMELFEVPLSLIQALDKTDVEATFYDMIELGIDRDPYEHYALRIVDDVVSGKFDTARHGLEHYDRVVATYHIFHGTIVRVDLRYSAPITNDGARHLIEKTEAHDYRDAEAKAMDDELHTAFLVLLATSNCLKERRENKLGRLGIGKKNRPYGAITTLRFGHVAGERGEPVEPGTRKRPHLRRGHIRNQWKGPRLAPHQERVWVAPCFIHKDEDWVPREAYRLPRSVT